MAPSTPPFEEAHAIVIDTVGCWLGGVWSDAEGAPEETRAADAERRCLELVKRVYGSEDKVRFERLRALEKVEVSELEDHVRAAAEPSGAARAQNLIGLLDAAASAERENTLARRAGDRVKKDVEGDRTPSKLTADEVQAVAPLSAATAFDNLLEIDLGDLTHEARAIAILSSMDRMEIARGLPKHLKVYVLAEPFAQLFGVAAPDVPRDALKPLKGGAWLAYVVSVAKAAGHPVPDAAKSLTDRELLAWGGAFDGLADKLRIDAAELSEGNQLKRVSEAVVRRLDDEYRASEAAVLKAPEPGGHPRHLGRLAR